MNNIAEVSIPFQINDSFSYSIPEGITNLKGKRVLVDFNNKKITGLVIKTHSIKPDFKLKEIISVLDEKPIANDLFLKFLEWIAEYYLCSMGEVISSAYPPNFFPKDKVVITLLNEKIDLKFINKSKYRKALVELLEKQNGKASYSSIKKKHKIKLSLSQLKDMSDRGIIKLDIEKNIEYKPKTLQAVKLNKSIINNENSLLELKENLLKNARKASEALDIIANEELFEKNIPTLVELKDEYEISRAVIKTLEKKGLVEIHEKRIDRLNISPAELSNKNELEFSLNETQENIKDVILRDISNGKLNHYIHGVTGSGKTLIYMHLIKDVIKNGKQAILLLPEISLTPQLTDRFNISFPGDVCTIHSGLSAEERYEIWNKINQGDFKIIIGPRSALFVPANNLGLIIIDEEHDGSYKQDSPAPRYNARDCALVRAKMLKIPVVLGSATPSLESYYNTLNKKYVYHRIDKRVGVEMPEIKTIDMKSSRESSVNFKFFTLDLKEAIEKAVKKNEGVILFQNRRGFASYVQCNDCGESIKCENCDVTLTYHKFKDKLICHYCSHEEPFPGACTSCGSTDIELKGIGTQQIEEELSNMIPGIKYARYDSDSIRGKDKQRQVLREFQNGKYDVLIGTQMISKGIDIERVSLVGIVDADTELFLADIRSSEKTYQLLNQVSGRAGRTNKTEGKVILQTSKPEHPAIKSVNETLNLNFLDEEMGNRRELDYPPFSRMIKIEFSSEDFKISEDAANNFYKILPDNLNYIDIYPPTTPLIAKVRNRYRNILVIKNYKDKDLSGSKVRSVLKIADDYFKKNYMKSDLKYFIDVDFYSIL